MVLLLMLILEVDVEHLVTIWTFFNVSAAISEMRRHFAFGKLIEAIVTSLKWLILHFK